MHRHHSASARETHSGDELVQTQEEIYMDPESVPAHDEQVRSEDGRGRAQPRYTEAKHDVGLD